MAMLEILLLGPFQVLLNGVPVTAFESAEVRALLAYLSAKANCPQRFAALNMLHHGRTQVLTAAFAEGLIMTQDQVV